MFCQRDYFCRGFLSTMMTMSNVKNCVRRFVNICTTTWLFSNYETKADYTGNDSVVYALINVSCDWLAHGTIGVCICLYLPF